MAEDNNGWSVNSGPRAYSPELPQQRQVGRNSSRKTSTRLTYLAAIAVVGLALVLWFGVFQSLFGMLPSSVWSILGQQPTLSAEPDPQQHSRNSDLEDENARLKADLAEKQQEINKKQLIIDLQQQRGEQEATHSPEEYTVTKRSTAMLNGKHFTLITDHHYVGDKDQWTQATCYVTPEVDRVVYLIDLIRRDQSDSQPKPRLATPETLRRANLSWPDVFYLGSSCLWIDGARYSKEDLSIIALSEGSETAVKNDQASSEPPPQSTPDPSGLVRNALQYRFKDMVGEDIRKLSAISQTECESLCINDRSCVGYTYDNWNRLCIPKSGISKLRLEPRSTTVILSNEEPASSTAPPVMTPRIERAFPDSAYRSAWATSYEVCSDLCLQDDACLGVNFIVSSSQCKFFAQPSEYSPRTGVTLGYKSQME
jgi:hypothetical protein